MSSNPDITPYVDLTVFDADPQDVFELALATLQMRMPDWEPREGNTEVLLLETMALEVAELVFAINRVPAAVTEVLLRLYGIERDIGQIPTAMIKFNMAGSFGYSIPAGTTVRLDVGEGLEPVVFTTDVELTIPEGQSSGSIAATGDIYTADANGTPIGTEVEVLDSLIYVDSAQIDSAIVDGRDEEDDRAYFDRAVQRLSRLSEALVLPRHFTSYVLEQPDVERAYSIDNYNPEAAGNPGTHGGHVTVAVYGANTALPVARRMELVTMMEAQAQANLAVHVVNPTVTQVNVTVDVVKDLGYENTQVIDNVRNALTEYLSWSKWNWSNKVRRNELIQIIGNAEGVAYVNTLTVPGSDLTLAGVANLVIPGVFSVTVSA